MQSETSIPAPPAPPVKLRELPHLRWVKNLLMSSAIKTLLFRLIITIVYGCEEVLSDKFCFTANNESISSLRIQ